MKLATATATATAYSASGLVSIYSFDRIYASIKIDSKRTLY